MRGNNFSHDKLTEPITQDLFPPGLNNEKILRKPSLWEKTTGSLY